MNICLSGKLLNPMKNCLITNDAKKEGKIKSCVEHMLIVILIISVLIK